MAASFRAAAEISSTPFIVGSASALSSIVVRNSAMISLGGWIRALEISSYAVEKKYTEARARLLYREDIADYYESSIEALDPRVSDRDDMRAIRKIIVELRTTMLLSADAEPTQKGVEEIAAAARKLASIALQRP